MIWIRISQIVFGIARIVLEIAPLKYSIVVTVAMCLLRATDKDSNIKVKCEGSNLKLKCTVSSLLILALFLHSRA
jgi:hypothetical protein